MMELAELQEATTYPIEQYPIENHPAIGRFSFAVFKNKVLSVWDAIDADEKSGIQINVGKQSEYDFFVKVTGENRSAVEKIINILQNA